MERMVEDTGAPEEGGPTGNHPGAVDDAISTSALLPKDEPEVAGSGTSGRAVASATRVAVALSPSPKANGDTVSAPVSPRVVRDRPPKKKSRRRDNSSTGKQKGIQRRNPEELDAAAADEEHFFASAGLKDCFNKAKEAEATEGRASDLQLGYLKSVYALNSKELVHQPGFIAACKRRKVTCTAATLKNPDILILKLVTPAIARKRASLLATALAFVRASAVDTAEFLKFVRKKGGVEGCAKEYRARIPRKAAAPTDTSTTSPATELVAVQIPRLEDGRHTLVISTENGVGTFIAEAPDGDQPPVTTLCQPVPQSPQQSASRLWFLPAPLRP